VMGKSLDDLPLDDQPLHRPMPVDAQHSEWYQFCQKIIEMLAGGEFDWASGTLEGIHQSVEQYQSVTEGQRRAVRNIAAARKRSDGWRKRRYEGFTRGGR